MAWLAALRRNLDAGPSPVPDHPGLLLRDPYHYTDTVLVIPSPLVPLLAFFDGAHTDLDLHERVVRLAAGDVRAGAVVEHLCRSLRDAGFLEDEVHAGQRAARERAFAESPVRLPAHAGNGYEAEAGPLRAALDAWLAGVEDAAGPGGEPLAVAAPHVSPEGGVASYRAAYRALGPQPPGRTYVILGTSHYGVPERFGLTRKAFRTPFGDAPVDVDLVDALAERGGAGVVEEDYVHSVEHSIEFQVVFLQHLLGPQVRILPILCGPFARRTAGPGRPEDDDPVGRFLEALAALHDREASRLVYILGVDLAHLGRRYGDPFPARADQGAMVEVAERDRARLERVVAADAAGFWALLQDRGDDLRWCGAAPLYTFLHAVRPRPGRLVRYEQWNIDEESVVSFAALAFPRLAADA